MNLSNYLLSATWFLPARIVLSFLYGTLISIRNRAYDFGLLKIHSVKTPVISVGNLSTGGSGKTILVQALVQHFLSIQKQPAVLSRGYGRSSKGVVVVADENGLKATFLDSGDEPYLIAENFPGVPVVVAENRVKGAQLIEDNFAPDVIILDDGFQHRRLHRDLDILIIDFQFSPKPRLLPWGNLREESQNFNRADMVLFSKNGRRKEAARNLVFNMDNHVQDHRKNKIYIAGLKGNYGLFAGLGKPHHFFSQIEEHHLPAQVKISLPDHAGYNMSQLAEIKQNSCDYWITTQKDFIKLDPDFCEAHNIYFIGVKTTLPPFLLDHLKKHFN
jgi:tetraacyldisaccharide 4'-kinase